MKIRRLGWAGIEVLSGDDSLVVDFVHGTAALRTLPSGAFVPPTRAAATALVTHLHADHTDVAAIESAVGPDGVVLRPERFHGTPEEAVWTAAQEDALAASRLDTRIVSDWQRIDLSPFTVTAVPSVDGLGDPQVNWVIEADGRRVFHGGDTVFHGFWWLIAGRVGPMDIAVLPINGAAVDFPHLQPASPLPAVLTPEQAVHAAVILGANALVPMHFGLDIPPYYSEEPDVLARVEAAASGQSLRVVTLKPGEVLEAGAQRAA
jgi:L-ascorbate metabolism protein UlaG (beta-lactamase superfamily)